MGTRPWHREPRVDGLRAGAIGVFSSADLQGGRNPRRFVCDARSVQQILVRVAGQFVVGLVGFESVNRRFASS